jgi:rapamycin-insensitive companion of mTOR
MWRYLIFYKESKQLYFLPVMTGLIYFCMDNMLAIRSLIDTLRIPSLQTRVSHIKREFQVI